MAGFRGLNRSPMSHPSPAFSCRGAQAGQWLLRKGRGARLRCLHGPGPVDPEPDAQGQRPDGVGSGRGKVPARAAGLRDAAGPAGPARGRSDGDRREGGQPVGRPEAPSRPGPGSVPGRRHLPDGRPALRCVLQRKGAAPLPLYPPVEEERGRAPSSIPPWALGACGAVI